MSFLKLEDLTFEKVKKELGCNGSFEEVLDECLYNILNLCGCGDTESVENSIRDYLFVTYEYLKDTDKDFSKVYKRKQENLEKFFGVSCILDNPLLLYMAYVLDSSGITEHGTSIGGAWITNKGIAVLWMLNKDLEDYEEE